MLRLVPSPKSRKMQAQTTAKLRPKTSWIHAGCQIMNSFVFTVYSSTHVQCLANRGPEFQSKSLPGCPSARQHSDLAGSLSIIGFRLLANLWLALLEVFFERPHTEFESRPDGTRQPARSPSVRKTCCLNPHHRASCCSSPHLLGGRWVPTAAPQSPNKSALQGSILSRQYIFSKSKRVDASLSHNSSAATSANSSTRWRLKCRQSQIAI